MMRPFDMAVSTAPPLTSTGRLFDKIAIITGSSSGIGHAIALTYIHEGAKVVYADVTPDTREPGARGDFASEKAATTFELLKREGGEERVMEVLTDASKAEDVKALVKKTGYTESFK